MKKLGIFLVGSVFFLFISCGGEDANNAVSHIVKYETNGNGDASYDVSYKNASGTTINLVTTLAHWEITFNAGSGTSLSVSALTNCAVAVCTPQVIINVDGVVKASLTGTGASASVTYVIP